MQYLLISFQSAEIKKKNIHSKNITSSLLIYSLCFLPSFLSSLCQYLGHPLTVLSLQALFGLLEVGVFVFISRRLQVVVYSVGGAGCGCGYCMKWKYREKKRRQRG